MVPLSPTSAGMKVLRSHHSMLHLHLCSISVGFSCNWKFVFMILATVRHTTIESTNMFPLFWTWSPNTKEVTVIIYMTCSQCKTMHWINTHTHYCILIYIYTHRYSVYRQEPKYNCWMFLEPRGVHFNGSVLASSCWQSIHHYLLPIDVKLQENLNLPFHTNSK